jgi:chromosome segregation ATPase
MELSAKYTKLVEETTVLKADNQRLTEENRQLKDRLGPCQNNLTQAQKELAEANDLLIEMRIEMNDWKTNILGFRDEMRNAENAQLDALVKILEVLGGQAKTETPLDPGIKSAITSPRKGPQGPGDPNQVQPAIQAATDSKQLNG